MKTSVTSYSFGSYIDDSRLGVAGIIRWAAEHGFDAVDFSNGPWSHDLSPDVARLIRETASECGITVASFCTGANFLAGNPDDEVERLKRCADFAVSVGARAMRHDVAPRQIRERTYSIGFADVLPELAHRCGEVTRYAEQIGLITMTENHGFFSQDCRRVEALINAVAHPNFGALVDIGNFMCADEDTCTSVGIMAPYAFSRTRKGFSFQAR